MKGFKPSFSKLLNLLYDTLNLATPGPGTSCLQLFGTFIMMQWSCFKQITTSQ